MKFLIIGHARHGKDTVAYLLEQLGYTHTSASKIILDEIIWPILGPLYSSPEECYQDRVNHRSTWFDLIKAKITTDNTFLARRCLEEGYIFTGIRSRLEFEAVRDMFDVVIWVDSSGRGIPPEPPTSMELTQEDADYILPNNGSVKDLSNSLNRLLDRIESDMIIKKYEGALKRLAER